MWETRRRRRSQAAGLAWIEGPTTETAGHRGHPTARRLRRRGRAPEPPDRRRHRALPRADARDLARCRSPRWCRRWTRRRRREVLAAADELQYRDFLTVALVVPESSRLPRQLDLHPLPRRRGRPGPELRLVVAVHGEGRPHLPRASSSSSTRATRRGTKSDEDLIEQAQAELRAARPGRGRRGRGRATSCGCRRRTRSTTQRYKEQRRDHATWLDAHTPNVHPVGRNGMHRYNNQDHSMFTAMLIVREHRRGHAPRRLDGQRRGGLPRVGRPARCRDARDGGRRRGPARPAAQCRLVPDRQPPALSHGAADDLPDHLGAGRRTPRPSRPAQPP